MGARGKRARPACPHPPTVLDRPDTEPCGSSAPGQSALTESVAFPSMSPRNKKAGQRRLVDMSPEPADSAWSPDLPPIDEWYDSIPISESVSYSVRYAHDEYGRLTDWAVIQRRNTTDGYRRVAVYDACHGKSVHVHIYDTLEREIDEHPLHRPVRSYAELEDGLDYAMERVVTDWQENERRSDRGQ